MGYIQNALLFFELVIDSGFCLENVSFSCQYRTSFHLNCPAKRFIAMLSTLLGKVNDICQMSMAFDQQ